MAVTVAIYTFLYMTGKVSVPDKALGIEFTTPGLKMTVESDLLGSFFESAQISMLVNVALIFALLLYSIRQLLRICKSLNENGTPFIKSNVKKIKNVSYAFFLYSIITFTTGLILKIIISKNYDVAGLSGITLEINTQIPFWAIVCGLFILGIAEIFSFGLKLQQDNDSIV
jgi:hypothetical protein